MIRVSFYAFPHYPQASIICPEKLVREVKDNFQTKLCDGCWFVGKQKITIITMMMMMMIPFLLHYFMIQLSLLVKNGCGPPLSKCWG